MKINRSKFKGIGSSTAYFILLPIMVTAAVKFSYRAIKDLRLPNKNDMWE